MSKALSVQKCIPCQGGMPAMGRKQAQAALPDIPGWELSEDATRIRRSFVFRDFISAQQFAISVGELAEEQAHHPDISYGWGYCTLTFYTHKIGGLHENDFIMAAKVNELMREVC